MATRSIYHVVPDATSGWKIRLEDTGVGTQGFKSRDEALGKAVEMARGVDEAQVVVHDINGGVERELNFNHGAEVRAA